MQMAECIKIKQMYNEQARSFDMHIHHYHAQGAPPAAEQPARSKCRREHLATCYSRHEQHNAQHNVPKIIYLGPEIIYLKPEIIYLI